jgi:hypothetical protein
VWASIRASIEACGFIEHNFLKGQGKMFGFIAKPCNLTMIGLVKAFLSKNMTDQGVWNKAH